jgi:GAF domain-containing protein
MLTTVVELTKERFGLYHAHLYIIDDETHSLKLAAGAGAAGRVMAEQGHRIPLNAERSIVARAARTGTAITSNDVRADPNFLPNPLLPETRSEISVPMQLGDQVIGVLDLQSDVVGHFTNRDRRVLGILANQIASAISNARLFQATQEALAETEALYFGSQQIVTADSYDTILRAVVDSTVVGDFDRATLLLFDHAWTDIEPPAWMLPALTSWSTSWG